MDSKLSQAQADPHRGGDVVVLGPNDWTDAEEALTRLAHTAADQRRPAAGSDFSAGPRVTEPSLDATLRPAGLTAAPSPTDRPARGKRASRSLARFLATACIGVAATLAWQSYGSAAMQMIARTAPQLGWLSPPATSPAAVAASPSQAASAQAGTAAPAAAETAASPAPTDPAPGLQQLSAMAHDLAALRQSVEQLTAVQQSVEQLAAGQEQMARDIAKLQSAGQEIRRRVSVLPPTATAHKPVPPPPPAFQSSAAALPPPPPEPAPASSAAPIPPASQAPLRPPMPVR